MTLHRVQVYQLQYGAHVNKTEEGFAKNIEQKAEMMVL
jgi:hypothetical protein